MILKAALVLACSTLALGFAIDSRIKRQLIPSILPDLGGPLSDSSPTSTGISDAVVNTAINAGTTLGSKGLEVAGDVISKGVNSAINAGSDAIQSGIASAINAGIDLAGMGAEAIGAVGGRVQGAIKDTFQEEKDSVVSSIIAVKDLIKQNIQTGANLAKTAIDLQTIVPKFGKNLILG